MEIPSTSKWIICRICLKNSAGNMLKIFSMDAEAEDVVGKIRECGGISLEDCDQFPDSICSKCLTLLKLAYKFRTLCQRSHQQLVDLLQLPPPTQSVIEEPEKLPTQQEQTQENIAVKHEEEITPEDSNSNGMCYIMESGGSEEVDNVTDEIISEAAIVRFIEMTDSSQTDDIEYLQDDDDLSLAPQGSIKLDSNSVQSNDDMTIVFEQPDETPVFECEQPETKIESVTGQKRTFCDDPAFIVEAKYKIQKKSTKKARKPKRNSSHNPECTGEEDTSSNFICFHCGNIYAERAKLTLHLKMHSKEKPHECEICHKRFAQTPQLSRHMNSHTGSRPFKCKYCPSSFADPSTCIKHERIHTNERPYKCEACEKAFSYSNVLKVHMMTHTGEKPFSCEFCGKKFAQLHHKKAHERTHNNQAVFKLEEEDLENDQYD